MVKKSKTKTKTVKPVKRKRHDWVKLQEEFNLYKIENREKTLKDFCKLKSLNYRHAYIKLKVKKSREKAKLYDSTKNIGFDKAIKKKPLKKVRSRLLIT
jgi:hypothetical protein